MNRNELYHYGVKGMKWANTNKALMDMPIPDNLTKQDVKRVYKEAKRNG